MHFKKSIFIIDNEKNDIVKLLLILDSLYNVYSENNPSKAIDTIYKLLPSKIPGIILISAEVVKGFPKSLCVNHIKYVDTLCSICKKNLRIKSWRFINYFNNNKMPLCISCSASKNITAFNNSEKGKMHNKKMVKILVKHSKSENGRKMAAEIGSKTGKNNIKIANQGYWKTEEGINKRKEIGNTIGKNNLLNYATSDKGRQKAREVLLELWRDEEFATMISENSSITIKKTLKKLWENEEYRVKTLKNLNENRFNREKWYNSKLRECNISLEDIQVITSNFDSINNLIEKQVYGQYGLTIHVWMFVKQTI